MDRRNFMKSVGVVGIASVAGCMNPTQQYGVGSSVTVREGSITLDGIRTAQTLFTQPSDTPAGIIGRADSQYVVFIFDCSDLDVEPNRQHNYLVDNLQYRLSSDTVAPIVDTPTRKESQAEGQMVGVAVQLVAPFAPSGTSLQWTGDTNVEWSADDLFSSSTVEYLRNPPRFTVESVRVPESTASDTAIVDISVSNNGSSAGKFKSVVRGGDTSYVVESVGAGETVEFSVEVAVSEDEQPVVVSWGIDQKSGIIKRS